MEFLQEQILNYLNKTNKKMSFNSLRKKLNISGESDILLFKQALDTLVEEGHLYYDHNEEYQIFNISKLNKVQGKLFISRKGNGYVTIKDKEKGVFNYFIHQCDLNGALSDDIVVLHDLRHMKSDHILAKVEKIVKRNHTRAVFEYHGNGVFTPYNQRTKLTFQISKRECENYVYGDRVLVELDETMLGKIYDTPVFNGKVLAVIGHKDDPMLDIKTIAYDYGFSVEFSKKALDELEKIPMTVSLDEMEGRVDLRGQLIFTIDGEDTKDIDDAISVRKENGFYYLGIHIANVSHYVKPGMALFEEAKQRATSAYLIDSVIPMLPHKLSNGICSLNPNVDRLAKSVEIQIDKNGQIVDYNIFESVINSKKQMTYTAVNSILEDGDIPHGYEEFAPNLFLMEELAAILEESKRKRGSIDFASNEVKIKTDEYGKPIHLETRHQRSGEKIIENFMLMANEVIATNFYNMDVPFVYRSHAEPNVEKFIGVLEFLKSQDLIDEKRMIRLLDKINNNDLKSYDIAGLLNAIKDEPSFVVMSNMILRCMSKAIYSPHNEGHYGLALKNYTHFTSPIRRFPDLMVHTLLDEYKTFERIDEIERILPSLCEHSSFMERQADEAEEAANELKMAEYMFEHIGETIEGTIVACNRFGLTVMLDNLVKGRVDFDDMLDGIYYYGTLSHQLINRNDHSKNYKIGDRIFIKVKEVSVPYRTINFYASKENVFECDKPKVRRMHKID